MTTAWGASLCIVRSLKISLKQSIKKKTPGPKHKESSAQKPYFKIYTYLYIYIYKIKGYTEKYCCVPLRFFLFCFFVGKFKKADIFPTCVSNKQMNNKNVARKSRDFSAGFTDSSLERLQFDMSCIWSVRMHFRVLVRSAVVKQFRKRNFQERTAQLSTGPWLLLDNYSFC